MQVNRRTVRAISFRQIMKVNLTYLQIADRAHFRNFILKLANPFLFEDRWNFFLIFKIKRRLQKLS